MGRFLKILGGVLGVLVIVLVGGVVYILNIDLNDWKPEIQEAVREQTGRELVIEGPIEFDLGSDTYLRATGITLSNADWGSRPQMVEVGTVEVELKLFSLLGNTPDITQVHVENVRAIVETDAQGRSNTEFETAQAGDAADDTAEAGTADHRGGGSGDLVLPIIRDVRIADVEVVMKDGAAGTEQVFTLTELTLGADTATDPLKLNLDAAFDGLDLIMQGQMGSIGSMTDPATATSVDFVGNLAGIDLAILGQIQDLAGQQGIDIKITALGQELADAARSFAKIEVPKLGGFKVDATLKGGGDSLAVAPLTVDVGTADVIKLTVDGEIADALNQDGIDLDIAVNSTQIANLSPITQKFAGQSVPALGPLDVALKVTGGMADGIAVRNLTTALGRDDLLKLDVSGGIDDVVRQRGIDLDVAVASPQVGALTPIAQNFAPDVQVPALGPLDAKLKVSGGMDEGIAVRDISTALGSGDLLSLNVTGAIENVLRQRGVGLDIAVASPQIGDLTPIAQQFAPDQKIPPLGPLDVKVRVEGDLESGMAANGLALSLGEADTIALNVTGAVADLLRQEGIDLAVSAKSPELGNLSDIAEAYSGQPIPDIGPMDLAANVTGGMETGLGLGGLKVEFGREETIMVNVTGGIGNLLEQTGVDLNIAAVSPEVGNLSPLVEAFSDAAVPALGPLDMTMKVAGDGTGSMALSDLALALGKAETLLVEANGSVADLVALSGADLGFKIVSPDLSVLSDVAGGGVPAIGPVDISGTIKGDQGEPITLDPFSAKIGGSDIAGTATLDGTGEVPSIVATLSSTRFDINDVSPSSEGGEASSSGGGQSGGQAAGGGDAGDGRVIPNDPLPFDALKLANADISYKAGTFVAAVAEMTNLDIGIKLQDGKLDITPFKAGIGGGTVDGTISLDGGQAAAPLSVKLSGVQMGLEALLAGAGMRDKIEGPLDLEIDLTGAGASPRAIAASLNGGFQMSVYNSRVLKQAFEDAFGSTIGSMLSSEGGWIVLDCTVFDYDIKDGLAETKAGFTASGPVTVVTEGTINLGTEELDLDVEPSGGIASLPLDVGGTFADPTVRPDATTVGIGIIAGVLTGGIAPALAAVVGNLPSGHPCKEEVAESQEEIENRQSSGEAGGGATIEEKAKETIQEGIGGGLKKLFGD